MTVAANLLDFGLVDSDLVQAVLVSLVEPAIPYLLIIHLSVLLEAAVAVAVAVVLVLTAVAVADDVEAVALAVQGMDTQKDRLQAVNVDRQMVGGAGKVVDHAVDDHSLRVADSDQQHHLVDLPDVLHVHRYGAQLSIDQDQMGAVQVHRKRGKILQEVVGMAVVEEMVAQMCRESIQDWG